jgi:amino acid adenylation domain-containing protein
MKVEEYAAHGGRHHAPAPAGVALPLRPDANLAWLVAEQARTTPEAVAIVGDQTLSYRALTERAEDIAAELTRQGLRAEQPVGVLMQRSADMVAVLLGILRAGGAYVPLDPEDPIERAGRMVQIAGCTLVVGDAPSLERWRAARGLRAAGAGEPALLAIDSIPPLAERPDQTPCAPGGDRLAYVLFTSGSTGEPKGVEVEHGSVVNLLQATRDLLGFTATDRYLATATIAFDISVAELFLPLVTGASLLLRDRNLLLDPARLVSEVRSFGVTVVQMGPSVWSVMLGASLTFPHVRVAITTGEPIAPALAQRLARVGDQAWNLYGPTETTVWATAHRLTGAGESLSTMSAPIGKALDSLDLLIIDEAGAPVPEGSHGELCVGGVGVARGYRNQPGLTAERFTVLGAGGQRYYRTGDLVCRDADATVHYFGRNDDQIKVHGVRIEPREVEAGVLRVPGVAQVAATWYALPSGSRSIAAAIVWHSPHHLSAQELHHRLGAHLGAQMIPSRFVFVDSLPLTPSGKVDRQAIRQAAVDPGRPGVTPHGFTDTEARLMMIWKRILGLEAVAADDHFFSIGGDSLAAMQMLIEVEAMFEVSLAVQAVFEAPTLGRLAECIDRARKQPDDIGNAQFVFPLHAEAPGQPLFFSNVDLKLARRGLWRVGCPLFATSLWARGQGFVQAHTLGELARAQIREIRRVQPNGPYRLGGYSLGGLIALEAAQQLQRDGDEVELLFLLDPMLPPRFQLDAAGRIESAPKPEARPVAVRLRSLWTRLRAQPGEAVVHVWNKTRTSIRQSTASQRLAYQLVHWHGRWPNRLTRLLLPTNRWPAFWYTARRLARDYVAQRYTGRTLAVFHARNERFDVWMGLLGSDAAVAMVDATHLGMFNEPALTEWMRPLDRALAPAGPG